jgi:hypothetical protein
LHLLQLLRKRCHFRCLALNLIDLFFRQKFPTLNQLVRQLGSLPGLLIPQLLLQLLATFLSFSPNSITFRRHVDTRQRLRYLTA